MWGTVRASLTRVRDAVLSVVGIEEVAIYAALALIAVGSWQVWRPGAFLVPGAVMLWMYLPQRTTFIKRSHEALPAAPRRKA